MLIFINQGSVEPAGGPAAYAGEVGAGQRPTRDSQFAYYGVLRLVAWLRALAHCRALSTRVPLPVAVSLRACGSMHEAPGPT